MSKKSLRPPTDADHDLALAYFKTRPGDVAGCAAYLGVSQGFVRKWWIEVEKLAQATIEAALAKRPYPPGSLFEIEDAEDAYGAFIPAPEIWEWVKLSFLDPASPLYNLEHGHLADAEMGFLWTNAPCRKQGRVVVGMCEMPTAQGNPWLKQRVEYQLMQWFGCIPDFLITLSAGFCAQASDATFCATAEHELYHAGQATDEWGAPRFKRDSGRPIFTINPHSAEEHIGVVRRYGVGAASAGVAELVAAGMRAPLIAAADIAAVCGTCL